MRSSGIMDWPIEGETHDRHTSGLHKSVYSGKYVADAVFDPKVVSAQCGAAPILKVMLDRQVIKL